MSDKEKKATLLDLTLILSNAVDLINPILHNHHKQVAYIAYHLAEELGLDEGKHNNLLIASLLHDIGGLTLEDRLSALQFEAEKPYQHAVAAYLLLKDYEDFKEIAKIIKYHHLPWFNDNEQSIGTEIVPFESHIIHLADRIAVLVNKDKQILSQVNKISKLIEMQNMKMFHPEIIKAFNKIKLKESFWLDIVSPSMDYRIRKMWRGPKRFLELSDLLEIAKIMAQVVDFRSRFTALHSNGVAAVAEALAQKSNWSAEECIKVRIAGYLHDIGKLAIPNSILEKKDKLTVDEYNIVKAHTYHSYYLLDSVDALKEINEFASLHHERLEGSGYPFHLKAEDLNEGSKIMAVSDVFTAITEDRPYRAGMSKEEALELIESLANKNALDKSIVSLLKANYEEINNIRSNAQMRALSKYEGFSQEINRIGSYYYDKEAFNYSSFSELIYIRRVQ